MLPRNGRERTELEAVCTDNGASLSKLRTSDPTAQDAVPPFASRQMTSQDTIAISRAYRLLEGIAERFPTDRHAA